MFVYTISFDSSDIGKTGLPFAGNLWSAGNHGCNRGVVYCNTLQTGTKKREILAFDVLALFPGNIHRVILL